LIALLWPIKYFLGDLRGRRKTETSLEKIQW